MQIERCNFCLHLPILGFSLGWGGWGGGFARERYLIKWQGFSGMRQWTIDILSPIIPIVVKIIGLKQPIIFHLSQQITKLGYGTLSTSVINGKITTCNFLLMLNSTIKLKPNLKEEKDTLRYWGHKWVFKLIFLNQDIEMLDLKRHNSLMYVI